jgi:hypothetical protein
MSGPGVLPGTAMPVAAPRPPAGCTSRTALGGLALRTVVRARVRVITVSGTDPDVMAMAQVGR